MSVATVCNVKNTKDQCKLVCVNNYRKNHNFCMLKFPPKQLIIQYFRFSHRIFRHRKFNHRLFSHRKFNHMEIQSHENSITGKLHHPAYFITLPMEAARCPIIGPKTSKKWNQMEKIKSKNICYLNSLAWLELDKNVKGSKRPNWVTLDLFLWVVCFKPDTSFSSNRFNLFSFI